MRIVRWMSGVKLQDRVPSKGLRDRLRLGDIISVLQYNRLQWYGMCYKKKAMIGTRPRGRPKIAWRKIVQKDCQARKFNR